MSSILVLPGDGIGPEIVGKGIAHYNSFLHLSQGQLSLTFLLFLVLFPVESSSCLIITFYRFVSIVGYALFQDIQVQHSHQAVTTLDMIVQEAEG